MLRDMDLIRLFVAGTGEVPPAFRRGGLAPVGCEYLDPGGDHNLSGLPPRPWADEWQDRRPRARASRNGPRETSNCDAAHLAVRTRPNNPSSLFTIRQQLLLAAIVTPWEGRVVLDNHDEPVVVSDYTKQLSLDFNGVELPDDSHHRQVAYPGDWMRADHRDREIAGAADKPTGNRKSGGLTMKPRALILRQSGDQYAHLYLVELTLHGYSVEVYENQADMLDALNRVQEAQVIVLDTPRSVMHPPMLERIRRVTRFSPPQVIWCGERNRSSDEEDTEFSDQLKGSEESVKMVLRGSYASFKSRLNFIEGWLHINKLPLVTIRHSIEFMPRVDDSAVLRRWSRPRMCDPREVVSDLLVKGKSILQASRGLPNPVLASDLYLFDWLEQMGEAVTLGEFAWSLRNDGPYSFAHRLAEELPKGISVDGARQALERLQRGMEVLGLEGDRVILERAREYRIDRTNVRVNVEHFRK